MTVNYVIASGTQAPVTSELDITFVYTTVYELRAPYFGNELRQTYRLRVSKGRWNEGKGG